MEDGEGVLEREGVLDRVGVEVLVDVAEGDALRLE